MKGTKRCQNRVKIQNKAAAANQMVFAFGGGEAFGYELLSMCVWLQLSV